IAQITQINWRNLRNWRLISSQSETECLSRLGEETERAGGRLIRGAIKEDELRGVAATVGEVRKELFGGRCRGRFVRGLCRRDQEIPAFVVAAAKPDNGNSSGRRCCNTEDTLKWQRQRAQALNLA